MPLWRSSGKKTAYPVSRSHSPRFEHSVHPCMSLVLTTVCIVHAFPLEYTHSIITVTSLCEEAEGRGELAGHEMPTYLGHARNEQSGPVHSSSPFKSLTQLHLYPGSSQAPCPLQWFSHIFAWILRKRRLSKTSWNSSRT